MSKINCLTPYLISGQRLKLHMEQNPPKSSLQKDDSSRSTKPHPLIDKPSAETPSNPKPD